MDLQGQSKLEHRTDITVGFGYFTWHYADTLSIHVPHGSYVYVSR